MLHTAQSFVGNAPNKKVADDFLGDRRQNLHAKIQIVRDRYEHAIRSFIEGPNDVHPLGKRFEMVEMNLDTLGINDFFGSPFNRNAGTLRCHHHDVPIRTTLEKTNIAIMGEDFWPELQVRSCFEDRHLRRAHEEGIGFVHSGYVNDKIQTARFIIVARLLQNTENRLGEREKIVVPKTRKSLRTAGYQSWAIGALWQGN